MLTYKDLDFAYMAGLLDGEGCIRVRLYQRNKISVIVTIQMTEQNALLLFKKYFGGGLRQKKEKTKGGLPVFRYYASRRVAIKLLKSLYPYLILKKARADLAFKVESIKLSNSGEDPRAGEKLELAGKLNMMNSSKGGISKIVRMGYGLA